MSLQEDGTNFSITEIIRMKELLTQIETARAELAFIQNYHESYSIIRICESASYVVQVNLNEKIGNF